MFGTVALLILGALGKLNNPYDRIKKQFEFEVPDERRPHFYLDHIARETPLVKDMLRDVICNPDYELNVEQVVGDPPPHADSDRIFDSSTSNTPNDMVVNGNLRGGDVNRGYTNNGPGGSKPTYKDTSLQSWVYVTSSDDPSVKPGFHRLADLRAWPDLSCDVIKKQPCGSRKQSGSGSTSQWTALRWLNIVAALNARGRTGGFSFGRRLSSSSITYLFNNGAGSYIEPPVTTYRTGIEALLNARCSTWLSSNAVAGATACTGGRTKWYSDTTNGCDRGRLELSDNTKYRPKSAYLDRFGSPTPPPRPPPKPPPPAPPSPPPPEPPVRASPPACTSPTDRHFKRNIHSNSKTPHAPRSNPPRHALPCAQTIHPRRLGRRRRRLWRLASS